MVSSQAPESQPHIQEIRLFLVEFQTFDVNHFYCYFNFEQRVLKSNEVAQHVDTQGGPDKNKRGTYAPHYQKLLWFHNLPP